MRSADCAHAVSGKPVALAAASAVRDLRKVSRRMASLRWFWNASMIGLQAVNALSRPSVLTLNPLLLHGFAWRGKTMPTPERQRDGDNPLTP